MSEFTRSDQSKIGSDGDYLSIVRTCEAYLERYGDEFRGVGWTKSQEETDRRYRVMLELATVVPGNGRATLLDFGCGASHLYEYMQRHGIRHLDYSGLDISDAFLALSRRKFPEITYHQLDVLKDAHSLPTFDYVVLNGIFNSRCALSFDGMVDYFERVLERAYQHTRIGLAFNVMSTYVDWERDDLFHLPFDRVGAFLTRAISRHFVVRHDYGLYEYTVYVYREPRARHDGASDAAR